MPQSATGIGHGAEAAHGVHDEDLPVGRGYPPSSRMGFRSPVVVSQCTAPMWVIAVIVIQRRRNRFSVGRSAFREGHRRCVDLQGLAICIMRWP